MSDDPEFPEETRDFPLVSALLDGVYDAVVECRFVEDTAYVRRANDAFVDTFTSVDHSPREWPLETFVAAPRDEAPVELSHRTDHVETTVTRRTVDGYAPFSLRVIPVPDADVDRPRQVAVYSDRPNRSQYDDRLEALHEATRELIHQNTREGVAQAGVEAAADVLDLPTTSIHLSDEEHDVLVPAAETEALLDVLGDLPDLPVDDSIAGRVFTEGSPLVIDDLSQEPEAYNPDSPLESEVILPLGDNGVMLSGSTSPGAFSDRLVWLATILASNTEAALDRIEREETLAERERELSRKNERLEAFARMVSHDLRNPLNVATGRVDLAARECDSEHLELAENALDRMDRLINELLEIARGGYNPEDVEEVSVDEIARSAWLQVETGEAALERVGDLGTVMASPSRLEALFENLFRNAVEHGSTSPRSSSTREDAAGASSSEPSVAGTPEDAVEHGSTSPPSQARDDSVEHGGSDVTVTVGPTEGGFYVADDGPGIPPEDADHVFEFGYTTSSEGSGMGLAIVAEVARAHGWEVSLADGVRGGARFEIDVGAGADG